MSYIIFFNVLKINILNKKKYFYFRFNKRSKQLLYKFIEINIISSATLLEKNTNNYKISIAYKHNEPVCKNIKNFYRKSHLTHINIKTLKKLKSYKHNALYLLSTNQGIITNHEALNYCVGGVLMCKVTL